MLTLVNFEGIFWSSNALCSARWSTFPFKASGRVLFFKVRSNCVYVTNEPKKSKGNKDDDMMILCNIDQYSHSIHMDR